MGYEPGLAPLKGEGVWHYVTRTVRGVNRRDRRHGKGARQYRRYVRMRRKAAMRERRDATRPRLVQFHF